MTYIWTQFHARSSNGSLATAIKREPKQNSRGRHIADLFLKTAPQRNVHILWSMAIATQHSEAVF
jgi:hypothetical protein